MAFLVDQAYGYLAHSHAEDRLAHAYLITGPEGAGKDALALRLIALTNGIHAETLESIRDEVALHQVRLLPGLAHLLRWLRSVWAAM